MSDVTLSIGGRRYKLACAAGEEGHITQLGGLIDGKLTAQPALARQSEAQTLLYAALLLADELHERGAAVASTDAGAGAPESAGDIEEFVSPLERLAQTLETIASDLERAS